MGSCICARFYYRKAEEPNNIQWDKKIDIVDFLKGSCYEMGTWDEELNDIDHKFIIDDALIVDKDVTDGIWFSIDSLSHSLDKLINDTKFENYKLNKLYNLRNTLEFHKLQETEKESLEDDIRYHEDILSSILEKYSDISKLIGIMQTLEERFESDYDGYWGGNIYAHCFVQY